MPGDALRSELDVDVVLFDGGNIRGHTGSEASQSGQIVIVPTYMFCCVWMFRSRAQLLRLVKEATVTTFQ